MKSWASIGVLATIAMAAAPARANLDLAQKNACTACHAVDKKVLGPSYREVARKYADRTDAVAQLADSIRQGGAGKWGPVPMPAQSAISDTGLAALAAWLAGGAR